MYIYDNFISIIQLLYYKSRTLNQSKHSYIHIFCEILGMVWRAVVFYYANKCAHFKSSMYWYNSLNMKNCKQFETPIQILNQYNKVVTLFLQKCYSTKCSYKIFCKLHNCGDKSWNVNYHSIFEFSYMTACKLCYFWQQLYLSGQGRLSNIKCYD